MPLCADTNAALRRGGVRSDAKESKNASGGTSADFVLGLAELCKEREEYVHLKANSCGSPGFWDKYICQVERKIAALRG